MKNHRNEKGNLETTVMGIVVLLTIVAVIAFPFIQQSTYRTETINVERTERVSEGRTSRYLVWTDRGVYKNTDSFLNGKWDSSDLYGKLKQGKTYSCDVVGWRVPFLSWYPNLISCNEAQS